MVNRNARDIAAKVLLEFWKGKISNDDLEAAFPHDKQDRALVAVATQVWNLYDDTSAQRIAPEVASDPAAAIFIDRCVRFLKSDLEYRWPDEPLLLRFKGLLWLFGQQWLVRRRFEKWKGDRDWNAWPFCSSEEMDSTKLLKTERPKMCDQE